MKACYVDAGDYAISDKKLLYTDSVRYCTALFVHFPKQKLAAVAHLIPARNGGASTLEALVRELEARGIKESGEKTQKISLFSSFSVKPYTTLLAKLGFGRASRTLVRRALSRYAIYIDPKSGIIWLSPSHRPSDGYKVFLIEKSFVFPYEVRGHG